ncbi:MAG: methylated-DNA--[protein]-cysteine S-methyltransferase [Methylococcales bacterium]|nr:methylated-DNA--[protein]-cysteine S-methyltransferase [Methylococcales bacterium]
MPVTINWVDHLKKREVSCIKIPSSVGVLTAHQSGNVLIGTEWCFQSIESLSLFDDKQCIQIQRYLNNPTYLLEVDLQIKGTGFRNQVWAEICRIPLGQAISYSDLARKVGSGARAVANACRDNPFPGIIPCHRVVAVSSMGGYMGETSGKCIEIKERLLNMEALLIV